MCLFPALVVVNGKAAGKVQWLVAVAHQQVTQGRSCGAESDGLELGAIIGRKGKADMPTLADDLRKASPVRREGKDRRGIARADVQVDRHVRIGAGLPHRLPEAVVDAGQAALGRVLVERDRGAAKVRQALEYAIDKDAFNLAAFGGAGA